jgi:hypothetical protein
MDGGYFVWVGFYEDVPMDELEKRPMRLYYSRTLLIWAAAVYSEGQDTHNLVNSDVVDSVVDTSRISFILDREGYADTIESNTILMQLAYDESFLLRLDVVYDDVYDPFLPVEYQREFLESFYVIKWNE